MARRGSKRQKQVERKRAERKAKRKLISRQRPQSLADEIARAARYPILHCGLAPPDFESQGMTQVIVSRQIEGSHVALAIFLVDVWCLGVKDAFARITSRSDYLENVYAPLAERFDIEPVDASFARKLVESSVEYARALGFQPHSAYRKAALIFGEADPSQSDEEFVFGLEGKPHFVSGPGDTPEKCRRIVTTLHDRLGDGGYTFMVHARPALPPELEHLLLVDEDLEDGDNDDWDDLSDEVRDPGLWNGPDVPYLPPGRV